MPKPRLRREDRRRQQSRRGWATGIVATVAVAALAGTALYVQSSRVQLDEATLCPTDPAKVASVTVLLVDVTDPMSLTQRQDFLNQLRKLKASVPMNGKLSVFKVGAIGDTLLSPVITRCNPGDGSELNELTASPQKQRKMYEEQFSAPLDAAFATLTAASGADQSPIVQSIQSASLTHLQGPEATGKTRRLVIASDLLQNTPGLSFYGRLPAPAQLVANPAFQSTASDLNGVKVDLWMLFRPQHAALQTRELVYLWDAALSQQGAVVASVYRVN